LLLSYLFKHGFKNEVYPINPKSTEISGLKCYSNVKDVPSDIDLACILVPYDIIQKIVKECAEKGVKVSILFSSGFAEAVYSEVGVKGVELQNDIIKRAKRSGMRICGPNCIGVISPVSNTCISWSPSLELQPILGDIAIISQSGALGGSILTRMWERGIGISRFISSGNEADLETADYIKYLTRDPHTRVIAIFLEGVRDGKKFREAAEMATKAMKPIVILKTGKSERGKLSVRSHTGSLAGDDKYMTPYLDNWG